MESGEASYASDIYSFGMVAWAVLTRALPWENESLGRDVYRRVVMKRDRPEIPANTPADMAVLIRSCWAQEPEERPTSIRLLQSMNLRGWES